MFLTARWIRKYNNDRLVRKSASAEKLARHGRPGGRPAAKGLCDNFLLSIQDDRYSAPILRWLVAASEGRAKIWAMKLLGESSHYLGVTCYRDGRSLFEIRADQARAGAPASLVCAGLVPTEAGS